MARAPRKPGGKSPRPSKASRQASSAPPAAKKRDYAAEYARRVAKAAEAGKTRQAGRGHKPGEAAERREREHRERRFSLTTPERAAVRKFAREQAKRSPSQHSAEAIAKGLFDWIAQAGIRPGWRRFERLRAKRDRLAEQPRNRSRTTTRVTSDGGTVIKISATTGPSAGPSSIEELEDIAEDLDLPDEFGIELLFYH